MQADRLAGIRQALYALGPSSIHQLAREVGASVATVRRDLQRLEELGLIVRTHGGAALAESSSLELAFSTRESQALAAKRSIGAEAYRCLRTGTTVFLDAGTTVLQLAKHLRLTPMTITAFTSSLAVADTLLGVEMLQVYLLGGRLRHENKCVVGPLAEQSIDGLWFDQLYLGASAIQPNEAVATPDSEEAALNVRMIHRATERILMVDSSKFGRHATHRVAPLSEMTQVITDDGLGDLWRRRLQQLGLAVTLAAVAGNEALA